MATSNKKKPLPPMDDLPQSDGLDIRALPQQPIASVEQFRTAVAEILAVNNMRLRTNIPAHMVPHIIRMSLFAEQYKSEAMGRVLSYFLETPVGVKGWGMGNLIKALQSLKQQEDDNGLMAKTGRLLGMRH